MPQAMQYLMHALVEKAETDELVKAKLTEMQNRRGRPPSDGSKSYSAMMAKVAKPKENE